MFSAKRATMSDLGCTLSVVMLRIRFVMKLWRLFCYEIRK